MKNEPKPEDPADREARIRELAYQLWEIEGRPEGRADHHWLQACGMLEGGDVGMLPGIASDDPSWLKRQEDDQAAEIPMPQPTVPESGRPVHELSEPSAENRVPVRRKGAAMI